MKFFICLLEFPKSKSSEKIRIQFFLKFFVDLSV